MRRSKTDLRARVNGDLRLEFSEVTLTSYAGLELFWRYLRATGFNRVVRDGQLKFWASLSGNCCASDVHRADRE